MHDHTLTPSLPVLSCELMIRSTSSQVNPILWRSLFTISLQFIYGLPGLLLNPATFQTSHCSACFGMRTLSILVTWPSHRNLLSRITFSRSVCPVLFRISSFVTLGLSLQVIKNAPQPPVVTVVGCFKFLAQCDGRPKRPSYGLTLRYKEASIGLMPHTISTLSADWWNVSVRKLKR